MGELSQEAHGGQDGRSRCVQGTEELGLRSRLFGSEQWFERGISGLAVGRIWEAERRDSAVMQQ